MSRKYSLAGSLKPYLNIAVLVGVLLLAGCGPLSNHIEGQPLGYDLNTPTVINMPPVLDEISGLSYYTRDSSLFAIQDEEGYLYKIFPYHGRTMLRWKFAGHGDFEDVVKLDSTFFVLRSDGSIFAVTIKGKSDVTTTEYQFPEKDNEFESLYWDDSLRLLVLVCKDCNADKRKTVSTWAFSPETRVFSAGQFGIDAKDVAGLVGEKKIKLKPSAAAIHPINHYLYILSSVNKLLIVANRDGTENAAYSLDEKIYKQPEGLAFAPNGTMFISNEQGGRGSATILMMPYRPSQTK